MRTPADYWVPLGRAVDPVVDDVLVVRDHKGDPVVALRFGPDDPPGVLGAGTTGGGKTTEQRGVLVHLVRDLYLPKQFWLADGKGEDAFRFLQGQPGVRHIVTKEPWVDDDDEDPIVNLVRGFHTEVMRRYAGLAGAKIAAMGRPSRLLEYDMPELMILNLDEYMYWIMGLRVEIRKEMQLKLAQCGQAGRGANARVWLWTQAPYAKTVADAGIPAVLKLQLGQRVAVVGNMSMRFNEGQIIFDEPKMHQRLKAAGDRQGWVGRQRKGLGALQVAGEEAFFKGPRTVDPLHWETSARDAAALWDLLPYRPTRGELHEITEIRRRHLEVVR